MILYYNTIQQRPGFYKMSPYLVKIMLKKNLNLHIQQLNRYFYPSSNKTISPQYFSFLHAISIFVPLLSFFPLSIISSFRHSILIKTNLFLETLCFSLIFSKFMCHDVIFFKYFLYRPTRYFKFIIPTLMMT